MTPQEAAQFLKENPVPYLDAFYNERLWAKQREIINAVKDHPRVAVKSCHGIGKSRLAADVVHWFLYTHPHSKVITTAPSFRQVQDILWREIRAAKTRCLIPLDGNYNQVEIDIAEDWFALGLSTDEPDRFQGFHAVDILLVIDEAAGVSEKIFEASEGVVSSDQARVLYLGNPTNVSGSFYQAFKSSTFYTVKVSAFDTPNFTKFGITVDDIRNNTWAEKINGEPLPRPYLITPAWVYDKYERWGEAHPLWQARVMGEFPNQSEKTLIPLHLIEAAVTRYEDNKGSEEGNEQIGVDVARFGVDKTIFYYRKGDVVKDYREFAQMDTYMTGQELSTFMQFHPTSDAWVDEPGIGAGVIDPLKHTMWGHKVHAVNTGRTAKDNEHYENVRAELYFQLRERFYQGKIAIPRDEELIAQLASLEYAVRNNRLCIEKKEDMKKRGLDSPDKADALALTFGTFETSHSGLLEYLAQATKI